MHGPAAGTTRRITGVVAPLVALMLFAASCGGGDPKPGGSASGEARPTGAAGTASPSPTSTGPEPASCPNGGQLIKAVEIPAVHADPVHIPEATVGGQKIAAVTIPGVDIPAQRVPAQCVDVRPAPGGCLSAVSIPGVTIPGVRIPEVEIPGVDAGGIKLAPERANAESASPVTVAATQTPEVCQAKPTQEGEYVASVYRPSVYRPSAYRASVYRPSVYRPSACNSKNECIRQVSVPQVSVPQVSIPQVSVRQASLQQYTAGRSNIIKGDDQIAYNIEADVLFDFGRADIKPAAATELAKIAASVRKEIPATAPLQVDGHTDAKGEPAANQTLSEQRAQAIVDWLATKGGIDRSRLKATGYGESKPTAANTRPDGSDDPEGRAKNRRVVISARQK
ncbi:OmpA family protein [Actinomadura hibisca]|uniref:OmpA family protein n=1 Tax=Actinomadura hibisca TaxID=68565 RepID=UPI000A00646B|nr:OmpA family protein [Actinomadura hibisca]